MEHKRPNGLSQGWFCMTCGEVVGLMGHEECTKNSELVRKLIDLNCKPKSKKEQAK